jgi:glucose dehydrogenase
MSGSPVWSWSEDRLADPPSQDFRPLAVAADVVVAGSLSGSVTGLDAASGRELWRRQPHDASVAFGLAAGGHTAYVPYVSGVIVALDVDQGRERWRFGGRSQGFRWAPLVRGAELFLSGASAGFLAIRDDDASERGQS